MGAGSGARRITRAISRAGSVTVIVSLASCASKYSWKPARVSGMTSAGVPNNCATTAISR